MEETLGLIVTAEMPLPTLPFITYIAMDQGFKPLCVSQYFHQQNGDNKSTCLLRLSQSLIRSSALSA